MEISLSVEGADKQLYHNNENTQEKANKKSFEDSNNVEMKYFQNNLINDEKLVKPNINGNNGIKKGHESKKFDCNDHLGHALPTWHCDLIKSKTDEKNKNVAIYGGSFDPPTIAHIVLACEIYNQFDYIDEVWIIPCGDGRSDKNLRSSCEHRINMLELIKKDLVYEDLPVYIDKTELHNNKYMPTIDLLEKLKRDYPTYNYTFCFGSDLLSSLPNWEYGETIINNYNKIVMTRPGHSVDVFYKDKCKFLVSNFDNSSTQIRDRISSVIEKKHKIHLAISGLTTRSVIDYIYENNLYKVESFCLKKK